MRGVASVVASVACWRPRRSLQQERVRSGPGGEGGDKHEHGEHHGDTRVHDTRERGTTVATIYYNIKLD